MEAGDTHEQEITETEDQIESIGNTLLEFPDLQGGTKTDLCRLLFRGTKGTVPDPGTVKPWLGWGTEKDPESGKTIRRVSSPWRQSKKWAEFLIEEVDDLLGDGSGEELGRLWRRLDRLRSELPPQGKKGARRHLDSGVDRHVTAKERRWRELSHLLEDADERFAEPRALKRVRDLDLAVQFRMTSELTNFEIPAYVSRTSDVALRKRVAEALEAGSQQWQDRIVLASGPPKSGKTRSVLEALLALAPDAYVLVKHPTGVPIGKLAEALIGAQTHGVFADSPDVPIVVVIEDAHLLLTREANHESRSRITNELRYLLCYERANERPLILVGTIHDTTLALPDEELAQDGISVLDRNLLKNRSVSFALELDAAEVLEAAATFSEQINRGEVELASLHELAATMAAIDVIDQRVTDALVDRRSQFANAALVLAILDTSIIEPDGASFPLLRTLADRWHQELNPTRGRLSDAAFDQAMSWATTPVGSTWALLNPIFGETPEEDRWRLLDAIAARRLPIHEPKSWFADNLDDDQRFRLAWFLQSTGKSELAIHLFALLAARRDQRSTATLARLLEGYGRLEEAEGWLRQAAMTETFDSTLRFGSFLERRGRFEEAEHWYRKAAESGHGDSMLRLGNFLVDVSRFEEAEHWFLQAAESGHGDSMLRLGKFLVVAKRFEEAEHWYRQAAESGRSTALFHVAHLATNAGRADVAEEWGARAADTGDVGAMFNMGRIFKSSNRLDEAESWFRRAAESGHLSAMDNLGRILNISSRPDEAELWFQRAADRGHVSAMFNLGRTLRRRERLDEAESWFRRAAESGHVDSMTNLGRMLQNREQLDEALYWYRQVRNTGDGRAMRKVGGWIRRTRAAMKRSPVTVTKSTDKGYLKATTYRTSLVARELPLTGWWPASGEASDWADRRSVTFDSDTKAHLVFGGRRLGIQRKTIERDLDSIGDFPFLTGLGRALNNLRDYYITGSDSQRDPQDCRSSEVHPEWEKRVERLLSEGGEQFARFTHPHLLQRSGRMVSFTAGLALESAGSTVVESAATANAIRSGTPRRATRKSRMTSLRGWCARALGLDGADNEVRRAAGGRRVIASNELGRCSEADICLLAIVLAADALDAWKDSDEEAKVLVRALEPLTFELVDEELGPDRASAAALALWVLDGLIATALYPEFITASIRRVSSNLRSILSQVDEDSLAVRCASLSTLQHPTMPRAREVLFTALRAISTDQFDRAVEAIARDHTIHRSGRIIEFHDLVGGTGATALLKHAGTFEDASPFAFRTTASSDGDVTVVWDGLFLVIIYSGSQPRWELFSLPGGLNMSLDEDTHRPSRRNLVNGMPGNELPQEVLDILAKCRC